VTSRTEPPVDRDRHGPNQLALARAVLAERARSFRIASWFLPGHMRDDAAVVYAFCRLVDDAADRAESADAGREKLAELRAMIEGAVEPTALVRAYVLAAGRLGFGLEPARALLSGAESDLGCVRVRDDAELLTYCYRVAGTVGLMMCGVLGVTHSTARAHAVELGVAMQLTNICRDVREDATLGRVYLPRTRLAAHGVANEDAAPVALLLATGHERTAVARVVRGLLSEAERVYDLGARGFPYIPPRPRLAIMVAARLYRGIGRRLLRRGGQALEGRTRVSALEKLTLVLASLGDWFLGILLPERLTGLLRGSLLAGPASNAWPSLSTPGFADRRRAHPR